MSADDPGNSRRPLTVTVLELAVFVPSLARYPITATTSPIFSEFRVQPFLSRTAGLPSSISQLAVSEGYPWQPFH